MHHVRLLNVIQDAQVRKKLRPRCFCPGFSLELLGGQFNWQSEQR